MKPHEDRTGRRLLSHPRNRRRRQVHRHAASSAFKAKMKASFDEVALLARKVKEVQIAQKQKERDFIQAKRAIERIRMVSGF